MNRNSKRYILKLLFIAFIVINAGIITPIYIRTVKYNDGGDSAAAGENKKPVSLSILTTTTTTIQVVSNHNDVSFWNYGIDLETLPKPRSTLNISVLLTELKQSYVIIAACAHNEARNIEGLQSVVNMITHYFGRYTVLLGESDSKDNTLEKLRRWALNDTASNVHLFALGNLTAVEKNITSRTMRIAHCRNTLLNAARTEFELSKSQYFFVCDPSQASDLSVFTRENFLSNFMYDRNEWAAFTATQTYDYYDIWPLRSKLVNHDALDMVNRYKANWTFWPAWDNFVTPYKRPIPLDYPHLIEVNSAFGGAAIYQSKYLKSCNYSGWLVDKEVSEHVPFHECIKNISGGGARIFINPKFQTATDWKD